ncbi:hypothetical protein [Streptomyces sp. 2A115]|uniref:hypothetical protein n=1 Tax=Streptomyces sp. 2A115 TaxID=3457439 RepID=UPI003FD26910
MTGRGATGFTLQSSSNHSPVEGRRTVPGRPADRHTPRLQQPHRTTAGPAPTGTHPLADPRRPFLTELPAAAHGGGFGLVGLSERVAALGGELHAAPNAGNGWELRALFPTRAL